MCRNRPRTLSSLHVARSLTIGTNRQFRMHVLSRTLRGILHWTMSVKGGGEGIGEIGSSGVRAVGNQAARLACHEDTRCCRKAL